ncbi:hypothetical protein BDR06DRAFT_890015, partial [Suillus hirtellus]
LWEKSPRYARTRTIDPSIPSEKYIKLVDGFQKHISNLYIQLHIRYVPLNHHLYRINRSDTPDCSICHGTKETIRRYIFDCPQYRQEHHLLVNALRRDATSISYILASEKVIPHLSRFINSTGRFKPTFGELLILSNYAATM